MYIICFMQKIKLLSDELVSQIAAGEVIERPASAVKELIENSIDAGATEISVEIEEGGLKKIRVADNGCGISKDDGRMAFSRHATSKIQKKDDLFSVKSLGFRGEALASIGSISKVIMLSSDQENGEGFLIEIDGGKEIKFEDAMSTRGTDIGIFGLFAHTPVRKKYMKSERTEYDHIFEIISHIALANTGIGFRLKKDGEEIFDLSKGQSIQERIRILYGDDSAEALLKINYQQSNLCISGFVGKPELSRSNKKYQFLFVNGRSIFDRSIAHAVKDAFHSLLMHEKFPWFLIDMEIDPHFIDVNVHPRKLEIRFLNQQEIYRTVLNTVKHALEANMLSPVVSNFEKFDFERVQREISHETDETEFKKEQPSILSADFSRPKIRPIAQVANSYIVAENDDGLVLIDQHAAHERVRYEKLMKALENEEPLSQPLLLPLELNFGVDSYRLIKENMNEFVRMGFDLEEFGGNSFILRGVPSGISTKDCDTVIKEMIADITKEWKVNHVKNLREFLLTYTACRGAVKFGDKMSLIEMENLIKDMESTKNSGHCPHGRPSMVNLTFSNLDVMFKRKNF